MEGDLSPRSPEMVELRSQLAMERAEKTNALAEAAEIRAAAAVPAPEAGCSRTRGTWVQCSARPA